MNDSILITQENYKVIFKTLTYGMKIVRYENEAIRSLFNKRIEVLNEFTSASSIEEKKHILYDGVDGKWIEREVPGVYEIILKNSNLDLGSISESNYNIEALAIQAKEEGIMVIIDNLESSLIKYAKKISKKHDVKFTGNGFNGKRKSESVKKQIEDAYLSGKCNIKFPAGDFNIQTIRNYVSAYGAILGVKIKVRLELGSIIVQFKEQEGSRELFDNIKESYNKLVLLIGPKEVGEFLNNLLISNNSLLNYDTEDKYSKDEEEDKDEQHPFFESDTEDEDDF